MPLKSNNKKQRTAPPEVRRKQLINATITCIGKLGITGTTLTAVTKEAGLSLGLVNFHFKSKDALLTATLNALAEEHRDIWMKAAERDDLNASDKLAAIVHAQFDPRVCSRKKLAVWFAFFGDAAHRKSYRLNSSHIDLERQERSAELCREIIARDGLTDVDAEQVSATLEGMFDGFWLNMLMYPDKFPREKARDAVFTYLRAVLPTAFADPR